MAGLRIAVVVRSFFFQKPEYTTTHLAREAARRGHAVAFVNLNGFTFQEPEAVDGCAVFTPFREDREAFLSPLRVEHPRTEKVRLTEFDIVFLRFNPFHFEVDRTGSAEPVLSFAKYLKSQGVLVINDPDGLAIANNKLYLLQLDSSVRPRTLVSRSSQRIKEFLEELSGPAILKPLCGFGGRDVFLVRNPGEINLNQIISSVSKDGYVLAQEYLDSQGRGDKRILLWRGRVVTAAGRPAVYQRVSPEGDIRSNIRVGGRRAPAVLEESDHRIVDAIRPVLERDGLHFVGVDIIGDKLLEVNSFCPGGIDNINSLYDVNVGGAVVEAAEELWSRNRAVSRALPPVTEARL